MGRTKVKEYFVRMFHEELSRSWTIILFFILYIFLLIFTYLFLSKILERFFITVILSISLFSVYLLIIVYYICKRSKITFCRNNPFFFQLPILILLSVALGAVIASIFYPFNLPYKIVLGPIGYQPYENFTVPTPAISFVCTQEHYKNFIDGKILKCKINSLTSGWNDTSIARVELITDSSITYFYPEDKGDLLIQLDNNVTYQIKAYYESGDINLDLFPNTVFLTEEEYRDTNIKRLGLIGAFLVFSLSVLTSFVEKLVSMLHLTKNS